MKKEVLRLERVTFRRDNVNILNNFSLSMMQGEIMGLQPIETYGLDELLYVLTDNPRLYFGYVYYMEQQVNSWKEPRHVRNRISVIGSQSSLVGDLDLLTNIFVLRPGFRQELIREDLLVEQLRPFLEDLYPFLEEVGALPEDLRKGGLRMTADRLSPFHRVLAELLRAVVAGHHLIILREVSSVITERELECLHRIMLHYADQGFSFLYISLHFEEIRQLCSSAAIFHDARIDMVMAEDVYGKRISRSYYREYYNHVVRRMKERSPDFDEEDYFFLEVDGWEGKRFSFSAARGECLVLQNLEARSYNAFSRLMTGEQGVGELRMTVLGEPIEGFKDRKMAVIREEPENSMVFPDFTPLENLCITLDHRMKTIWLRKKAQETARREYIRIFGEDICAQHTSELSKTERLKMVYMRVLLEKPDVVFILQPFKGADVDERYQTILLIEMLLERGITVVIQTISMGDSLAIADRVIRIQGGDRELKAREFRREDFPKLPWYTPWVETIENH